MTNSIQEQTKKCPKCQTEIPQKATVCPNCKSDLRNWFLRHPIISFILFLFVIGKIGQGFIETLPINQEKSKIIGGNTEIGNEQLDPTIYEIMKTNHNNVVQNYYVLIKYPNFNIDNATDFIKKFRVNFCVKDCNIELYDSNSIFPLLNKYPLDKKEYLNIADHFIASSSFDAPDVTGWYPFQDIQYKEYGGKNWKKEPIK